MATTSEVIISGFGGQGTLFAGQVLAYAGMDSDKHVTFFEKAEEQFMAAGKERFAEGYERAMELFDTIGWKDKALSFGEKAAHFYENNRLKYGDRLRVLSPKIRKIAGDDRYDRFLEGLGRGLGSIVGGSVREDKDEDKSK